MWYGELTFFPSKAFATAADIALGSDAIHSASSAKSFLEHAKLP